MLVPRHGTFNKLAEIGHRLLVAADGLWLEVNRPWLHLIWPLGEGIPIAIPYGSLSVEMQFAFQTINSQLLKRFLQESRDRYPHEHAAWLVWDEEKQSLAYRELTETYSSTGAVKVIRPALPRQQHLCVDMHSHGQHAAIFSATDDADDRGEYKISIVCGDVMRVQPSIAVRLCIGGLYVPVDQDLLGDGYA